MSHTAPSKLTESTLAIWRLLDGADIVGAAGAKGVSILNDIVEYVSVRTPRQALELVSILGSDPNGTKLKRI